MVLIGLGFMGNYLHFKLFFGVDFIFGSIAVFLVIDWFGVTWGTIAGMVAGICTFWLWGHPYAAINYTLEAWGVGYWFHRNRTKHNLVTIDALYWLFIGIPLSLFFYSLVLGNTWQATNLIALKQAVNALFNVLIASIALNYVPRQGRLKKYIKSLSKISKKRLSFQQTIFNFLVAFVIFPALTITIIDSQRALKELQTIVVEEIGIVSTQLEIFINDWYQSHINGLKTIQAILLSGPSYSPQNLESILFHFHQSFPNFTNLYVTDARGNITAAYPPLEDKTSSSNISDDYKWQALKNENKDFSIKDIHRENYIEGLHLGLALPLNDQGQWQGLLYGSISPEAISTGLLNTKFLDAPDITIVNDQDQVIASNKTGLTIGSQFGYGDGKIFPLQHAKSIANADNIYQWFPSENKPALALWKEAFYFQESDLGLDLPWRLILQISTKEGINTLENLYIKNLSVMLMISLVAVVAAKFITKTLLKPIDELSKATHDIPEKLNQHETINLPSTEILEFHLLTTNF
ncbi:MAG: hypothetical protein HC796_11565, partial [Synechococcaceae cyanobacterium RL_1_2]|nr:hypothetical protein [Synechococcaceae cyanobacterium RL_1_2]